MTNGGIDTLAEIEATRLGIKKEIYSIEVERWNDIKKGQETGFRAENGFMPNNFIYNLTVIRFDEKWNLECL